MEINILLKKYPDRIPVIIEKCDFLDLENYKYLLPKKMYVSYFLSIIKTKMNKTFDSRKAIFTFVKSGTSYFLVSLNENMETVYDRYKNDDGFLYIKFGIENTFG
jgi:GABA(A) receptor-associated protein